MSPIICMACPSPTIFLRTRNDLQSMDEYFSKVLSSYIILETVFPSVVCVTEHLTYWKFSILIIFKHVTSMNHNANLITHWWLHFSLKIPSRSMIHFQNTIVQDLDTYKQNIKEVLGIWLTFHPLINLKWFFGQYLGI